MLTSQAQQAAGRDLPRCSVSGYLASWDAGVTRTMQVGQAVFWVTSLTVVFFLGAQNSSRSGDGRFSTLSPPREEKVVGLHVILCTLTSETTGSVACRRAFVCVYVCVCV